MKIRQLSVNYLPEQDRILVRCNTTASEEMRLWLTRRLMVGLWPLLSQLFTQQLAKFEPVGALDMADDLKKMLVDFRKDEFLRQADFQTPYEEQPTALPLGPAPLLVTDVDVTPLADGGMRLNFHERLPNEREQRSFQMQMDSTIMQGHMHLLEQALQRSQWNDSFGASFSNDDASQSDAHEPGVQKPRYLN